MFRPPGLLRPVLPLFAQLLARQIARRQTAQRLFHGLLAAGACDLHQDGFVGDPCLAGHRPNAVRDVVDQQRLRDGRARFSDHLRNAFVCVSELLLQQHQPFGLFERRQVLALDVLDQGDLQRLLVVDVQLDRRDLVEAGQHRRAVAALAGDDLIVIGPGGADENGLQDAFLADGRR